MWLASYERLAATIRAAIAAPAGFLKFSRLPDGVISGEKGLPGCGPIRFTVAALCAVLVTLGAGLAAPATATADAGSLVGTWFASDLGPGGHVGGNLLSSGAANGSGELTFPTPNGQFVAHVQAVSWSPLSPTADGVIVGDSAGDTFCFVLPVTKGAPSHDIGVAFSSDCSLASPSPGAAGKVNPIP